MATRPNAEVPRGSGTPDGRPATRSDPILERLTHLHPKLIDLSLDRLWGLLDRLGNPHRHLPPVVHVAGTNGKGSTVAFLRAMLEAAGHRVHVYTSPHLVRFHERIRLAGRLIEDDALAALLVEIEAANAGDPITFFEVTTCAAFLAFARTPADVVLLETGLGGRLDATNVVERPVCTAITRVSFDHMHFLGDTLAAIAGEKAGIMKPGVPAVVAPQLGDEVVGVFRTRAAALGCDLRLYGEAWRTEPTADGFRFQSAARTLDLPPPGLLGAHQILNAGTAIACLEHVPLAVPDAAVRTGLHTVEWPARLQRLRRGPLPTGLPAGWELWLDGAHNDSGGEVLAAQAGVWARSDGLPLDIIFGGLNTRDPADVLRPLQPYITRFRGVTIPDTPNALTADAITAAAVRAGVGGPLPADGVAAALADLTTLPAGPRRILICGSLYLAGSVLTENG
ncbi:MAG TPA: folylpolyglutamate synthase/dihydrofolate synthase family protein [Azospirillaceae bacterium]|nr:folylpolyglutamate synthase/dihydrofolate synthase family protein [Azospirillaceae bacterium]